MAGPERLWPRSKWRNGINKVVAGYHGNVKYGFIRPLLDATDADVP